MKGIIHRLVLFCLQIKANLWSNIRYLPLVEDVCSRTVSEDELSHLLDYLLDFACDEKMLGLYKRVCRKYLIYIPVVLGIMLKHIRKCGKMKIVTRQIFLKGKRRQCFRML